MLVDPLSCLSAEERLDLGWKNGCGLVLRLRKVVQVAALLRFYFGSEGVSATGLDRDLRGGGVGALPQTLGEVRISQT